MQLHTKMGSNKFGIVSRAMVRSSSTMFYSAQQHRVPKMLPLFPVEYVKNCSKIHFFNFTWTYRNKIEIFWRVHFREYD